MKVALIGDVHANLPALEAVLEDAHQRGIEAIWNVGDFVGYGAFPDEVVKCLQQEEALSIIGNYDINVLKAKKKKKKSKSSEEWAVFRREYESLSKPSREYLRSLPEEARMEIAGKRILLIHGSPTSIKERIGPDTSAERLYELAELAEADIIISGHAHQPSKQKIDSVWFINPGSVGRPDGDDLRASYAIMQLRPNFFQLRHYLVEYDMEKAAAALRERESKKPKQMPIPEVEVDESSLEAVIHLAETCEYEVEHTHQVTKLALKLFDELQIIHNLGNQERFWLHAAGLLHDIGWIEGQKGHHKTALRTILSAKSLPYGNRERLIIGSIARYHRGALPKKKHSHFAALNPQQRRVVSTLAAILRVADGLDRTHQNLIKDLSCETTPERILVRCSVNQPAEIERMFALKKGQQLLEKVMERELVIEWQQI